MAKKHAYMSLKTRGILGSGSSRDAVDWWYIKPGRVRLFVWLVKVFFAEN